MRSSRFREGRGRAAAAGTGLLVLALAGPLRGDTVLLHNGSEIQGEVLEEGPQRITVRFPGGVIHLPRRDVASIRRESRLAYLLEQGELALRRKDPRAAREFFRQAGAEDARSEQARAGLARAEEESAVELEREGYLEEAASIYREVLGRSRGHPRAAAALARIEETLNRLRDDERAGRAALEQGEVEEALERLRRVHQAMPGRREEVRPALTRALVLSGHRRLVQGRLGDAEALYLEAASLDPDVVPAVAQAFALARARRLAPLVEQADFARILEGANEGLNVAAGSELLLYFRGLGLEGLGRRREAAEAYLRASGAERPGDPERALEGLRRAAEARVAQLLGAEPAGEDPRRSTVLPGGFRELLTPHFLVVHRNDLVASQAAEAAEAAYLRIHEELKCPSHWIKRCTITLFPTREDFLEATGHQGWTGGSHLIRRRLGTLADHGITSWQLQPRLLEAVIPHEVAHALLAYRLGYNHEPPLWLNEGFAIHWEPSYVHRYYRRMAGQAVRRGDAVPLATLVSLKSYPESDAEVRHFYAQSHTLVEVLLAERKLADFLEFAGKLAEMPAALDSHLELHYRIRGLKALEGRWLSSLRD